MSDLRIDHPSAGAASRGFRYALIFSLTMTECLPLGLLATAIPLLMRRGGASMAEISMVSMLMLPWGLKALWAPLVDKIGARSRFGRYRGWIFVTHPLLLITITLAAFVDVPVLVLQQRGLAMAVMLWLSIVSATADTASHGLVVNMLSEEERGIGNGIQSAGSMTGWLIGGGIVVMLIDWLGWRAAMLTMAAPILLPLIGVALYKEGAVDPRRAITLRAMLGFFHKPRIWRWLATMAALWAIPMGTTVPFSTLLMDRNMSLTEFGFLTGVVGNLAGAIFGGLGGVLVARYGRQRAFYVLGLCCIASLMLSCLLVARATTSHPLLYVAVIVNAGGMSAEATILFVMMMDRSRDYVAGSDYSIQFSLMQLVGFVFTGVGGFFADRFGSIAVFLGVPMLTLGVVVAAAVALDARDFQPSPYTDEGFAGNPLPPVQPAT